MGKVATLVAVLALVPAGYAQHSAARQWNEELLSAIRIDFARPTVHARNLCHVSMAMWDAWAAYDGVADPYIHYERANAVDVEAARAEAISYAAYRVLLARFANSPGAAQSLPSFDAKMDELGYDRNFVSTLGDSPAALGNRIAQSVLLFGANDNSNEAGGFVNQFYEPVNPPLLPALPGNPDIIDPNLWQPLALDFFIDQSGNPIIGGFPEALSPEWGIVTPFALSVDDVTIHHRDGFDYWVYHDPGPPPFIAGVGDDHYKWGFELAATWSSHLDPTDGVMWDISPGSLGNAQLVTDLDDYDEFFDKLNGGDNGTGYAVNPVTGQPYEPQIVPRGDYVRVLAEFWADGPASETPPGHWFTILNYVSDHPLLVKRIGGSGPVLDDLQWDVKCYLALGGAMHDVAIACWGAKGWYDYIRPVSAIRYMCDRGQSSDPGLPSFHPNGINLIPEYIELVTQGTILTYHSHLAGPGNENVGKIALYAWRGPEYISDPLVDDAGVGWILAENWWPYQRPSFVTPPFPGYTSGHSTYSRAAAWVMTLLTGSEYFPGGLGEFHAPRNEFLVFEDGPSVDIILQWARYQDASDQTSLSRIWGGIHPPADDIPGRLMGNVIGPNSYAHAVGYFNGTAVDLCPDDPDKDEPGVCGCGVPDIDSDDDGTFDCFDGCPNDATKTAPGICGCGIPDSMAPSCVPPIPTVSHWGLIILALLLLTMAKIHFDRRLATG